MATDEPVLYYRFGGRAVAWSAGGSPHYLTADHLGSVQAETDGGTTRERRAYPFGSDRGVPGALDLTRDERYTEQKRVDDGSGVVNRELYHYGARFYLPGVGLFSQPDTVVPDPKNPQALNRYAYVLNNPLRYSDPTGHAWIIPGLVLVGAVTGGASAAFTAVRQGKSGRELANAIVGGAAGGAVVGATVAVTGWALGLQAAGSAMGALSVVAEGKVTAVGGSMLGAYLGGESGPAAVAGTGLVAAAWSIVPGNVIPYYAGGPLARGLSPNATRFLANQTINSTVAAAGGPAVTDAAHSVQQQYDSWLTENISSEQQATSVDELLMSTSDPFTPTPVVANSSDPSEPGSYSGVKDYWNDTNIGCY